MKYFSWINWPDQVKAGRDWTLLIAPNGGYGYGRDSDSARKYRSRRWKARAETALLEKAAPRLAALGRSFYNGCGFHYSKVASLGKAIVMVSDSEKPEGFVDQIIAEVVVEQLFKSIAKAEKTVVTRYSA